MPLEFALRPRFDLERPPPRRRFSGFRLPSFTLPVVAWWLAIGGGALAWLRAGTADAFEQADAREQPGDAQLLEAQPPAEPPSDGPATLSSAPVADLRAPREPEPLPAAPAQDPEPPVAQVREPEPPPGEADELRSDNQGTSPTRRRTLERELARRPPDREEPARRPSQSEEPPRALREPAIRSTPIEPPAPNSREAPKEVAREEAPRVEPPAAGLPSCESAAASANQKIDLRSTRGAPDLTRGAFASVLENGAYFSHCGLGARTALEICAAVQDGKVVGVSVSTEPRSATVNACVRRAVAGLRFPRNAQLDVTRTRFEAER
ncbi:MAG TPA: hypothetical protein VFQ61_02605 [Polyangiaceae bacterium]|nr:hypothetical protein [Polyangiaceae bacterium]